MRELGFVNFKLAETDNVSRLERLKTALELVDIKPRLYDFSMPIYTYYRYVRNRLNHNCGNAVADAKLKNAFNNLIMMKKDIDARFNYLDSLTACNSLNFGDYVLCTANIKNIADLMVVAIEKKVDWNNFYLSAKRYPTIKKIKGYKQDRQVKFIQNTILNNFSVKLPEEVCSPILENTIAHFE